LGIAYGSAVETGELLQLALDAEVADAESLKILVKKARRTERLLVGMLKKYRQFQVRAVFG